MAMGFASCGGDENGDPKLPTPNKDGMRLTKFIVTDISAGENPDKEVDTFTLEYGANGYISKLTDVWEEGSNGKYSGKTETFFTYNDKNQLTKQEEFEYGKDSTKKEYETTIIYKYNEKGLIISDTEFDKSTYKTNYEYNEKNQLVKEIQPTTTFTYEYDTNGKLSTRKRGDYETSTFTFDDNKNPFSAQFPKEYTLINPVYFASSNILTRNDNHRKSIYIYDYNENGYPTKATEKVYSSDNKLERTITTEFFYE